MDNMYTEGRTRRGGTKKEGGNENWWDSYRDKEESSLQTLVTELDHAALRPTPANFFKS